MGKPNHGTDRPDPADLAVLGMSEAAFMQDVAIADEVGRRLVIQEPRAVAVSYLPERRALSFDLSNGATVTLPVSLFRLDIPEGTDLATAFRDPAIQSGGEHVFWEALGDGVTVPGSILKILYGHEVWQAWSTGWGRQYEQVRSQVMAEFGRKGGAATSPDKVAASRVNGKKGGRPRKVSAPERPTAAGE